ncbi:hypothetical protein, partial [Tenacibaculum sp. 190524A05c]|uniref:hypothetical protein n=1 Tax=Tenacibaculum platacis TaxID=3137852 RepID=UPI0032B18A71
MNKLRTNPSRRIIAVFFILNFMSTIVPVNLLYANNNGPKAPEAGSFEPVDATDMVNLLTGDFSYVLPLLNVPSPEGGYPISLAYHAGIAMDQEASWTGLGWNLNPGAINRSVNGFPDDYSGTKIHEHFYDKGGSESVYSAGIGYSNGAVSIGTDFSWGTNKSFGGSVSFGYGFNIEGFAKLGTSVTVGQRNSLSVGFSPLKGNSGLTLGASIGDSGVSGNIGYSTSNGSGFSISGNSSGGGGFGLTAAGKNNSLGANFKFSKNGIGISGTVTKSDEDGVVGGFGTGVNISFNNTVEQGDYVMNQYNRTIPVVLPTPVGVFSGFFGKQKVEWYLNNTTSNIVYGPAYFQEDLQSNLKLSCTRDILGTRIKFYEKDDIATSAEANDLKEEKEALYASSNCECEITENVAALMDVYEFPLDQINFTHLDENNAIYPNLDNFNISAQGISGSMSLRHFENASLFGLSKTQSSFETKYGINGITSTTNQNSELVFDNKPFFYFENEFSTYSGVDSATFETDGDAASFRNDITDYHLFNSNDELSRRRVSKVIEFFTNQEINDNNNVLKYAKGYIKPSNFSQTSTQNINSKGIGAFTITGSDGKKYHYSIPVYNHVTVTRNFGGVKDNNGIPKKENESYFERLQTKPYATHWLLTAITGTDYIDLNNNHKVDEEDYGYWIDFDYGKWSEVYGWKSPYGKDYILSKDNDDLKTRVNGFKDVYYLDAIKSRTHTAVFMKSLRRDNVSTYWDYETVKWEKSQNENDYNSLFKIPAQRSLKLNKIILLKNKDANNLTKDYGDLALVEPKSTNIDFHQPGYSAKSYDYHMEDKVFDISDIPDSVFEKAVKVVEMNYKDYDTSLCKNTPNSLQVNGGRLTLESVHFNGRGNNAVLPPYSFDYYNERNYTVNESYVNEWGYYKGEPWQWSLKEIHTPEGGKIKVEYESDDFEKPLLQNGRLFRHGLEFIFENYSELQNISKNYQGDPADAPEMPIEFKVYFNQDNLPNEVQNISDYFDENKPFYIDLWLSILHNYSGHGYKRSSLDIKENYGSIQEIGEDSKGKYMIVQVNASLPHYHEAFLHSTIANSNGFGVSPVSNSGGSTVRHNEGEGYLRHYYKKNEKLGRYNLPWHPEESSTDLAYSLEYAIVGNKDLFNQVNGDLRVKKLITTDGIKSQTTNYLYNQKGHTKKTNDTGYKSSGTVSYIPHKDNNPIPYASELPAPKVMYEYVTVQNEESQMSQRYRFNVMKEKETDNLTFGDFLKIEKNQNSLHNELNNVEVNFSQVLIHDNLASIGQLLEQSSFNREDQLLSKTTNEYFSMDNRNNNQGVEQQSYQTYKEIEYKENLQRTNKWLVNASTRRNYAQALKKSTTTSGGYSYTTDYTKYDLISGGTLETQTQTSNGLNVKSVVIPAYHKYSQMGSVVDNINNKNMLTQNTGNYTFINKKGTWKPANVGITTWNNNWTYKNLDGTTNTPVNDNQKIWRKHKSFVWDGEINEDGTYINYNYTTTDDDGFDWTNPFAMQPSQWKQVSETTLYDHYSMPLEVKDINNNYASTKMWDNDTKVVSTSNAKYTEHFTSDSENIQLDENLEYIGNGILLNTSVQTDEKSHTGKFSVKIDNTKSAYRTILKTNEHREGVYRLSVWAHKDNYQSARVKLNKNQSEPFNAEIISVGNWVQLNHEFYLDSNQQIISITAEEGIVFLDDYRLNPIASAVKTYVYNEYDELEATLGSNNLATKYQYNMAGKLIRVYQEVADTPTILGGFKRASEYRYNYSREIIDSAANNEDTNSNAGIEGEVGLTNVFEQNGALPSTAKLVGTPGLTVIFSIENSSYNNGSSEVTFEPVGSNNTLYEIINPNETRMLSYVIPESGEIVITLKQNVASNLEFDNTSGTRLTIVGSEPDAYVHTNNSFRDINSD